MNQDIATYSRSYLPPQSEDILLSYLWRTRTHSRIPVPGSQILCCGSVGDSTAWLILGRPTGTTLHLLPQAYKALDRGASNLPWLLHVLSLPWLAPEGLSETVVPCTSLAGDRLTSLLCGRLTSSAWEPPTVEVSLCVSPL